MGGFQDKLLNRRNREDEPVTYTDEKENISTEDNLEDISKNLKFFGIENIKGYLSCIDLRFPDGNCKAIPYSYVIEINFDTANGIEVTTATKKVIIKGRNLKMLYKYLLSYRVKYIQANIGHDVSDETALFVKEISIEEL